MNGFAPVLLAEGNPLLLVLLAVGGFAFAILPRLLSIKAADKMLEKSGRVTKGWIVQANEELYQLGSGDKPALVLFVVPGPNAATDEHVKAVARKLFALHQKPKNRTPVEKKAAHILADADNPHASGSGTVPKEFAGGAKVYWARVIVERDKLPGRNLKQAYIQLRVAEDRKNLAYKMIPYLPDSFIAQQPTSATPQPRATARPPHPGARS